MAPVLLVSNFERSLAFYVDVLGFDVLFTRLDPDGYLLRFAQPL